MAIAKSDLFLVDGYNIACALKSFSPACSTEEVDATVLCSTYRAFESGFKSGSLSTEGIFDSDGTDLDEIHDVLSNAFDEGTARAITASVGNYALGGHVLMLDGCSVEYQVAMPLGQLIMSNAEMRSTNGLSSGKWLISAQRNAGTFNSTAVNNGAATTDGGLFHSHLDNDDATGVKVLCQHSTNGSAWVDLAESVYGTQATGGYTFALNPSNTNTIDFNGVTFNFLDTVLDPTTDIDIKGTLALTMVELAVVLNASVDADVALATYTATATGISVLFDEPGVAGNAYTLDTANGGNSTRTGAALTGGLDLDGDDHLSDSVTIARGTTIRQYLRTVTTVYGGDTDLVSGAFARRY